MKNKGKNVTAKYIKERIIDPALIVQPVEPNLRMIIVVPCYKEEVSDLIQLCQSLSNQTHQDDFEMIVVVNNALGDESALLKNKELIDCKDQFNDFNFPIFLIDKTDIKNTKKAGVGLARKFGLDEGLRRFNDHEKNGILVCLDADCTVAVDYIEQMFQFFKSNPKLNACSIGFKHRLEEIEDENMLKAIIQYELHLRYYIQIQEWIGLPFALQTVGSAMAVRSEAYAAQGGMPVLKAGEDFYFLHKFIGTGKCGNLEKALVFPSGRISDRVPFGTGRAVGEIIAEGDDYLTYHPQSFELLKNDTEIILNAYPNFKHICESVNPKSLDFYNKIQLRIKLEECAKHTADKSSFEKRFFRWFDAFLLMKYVHYMRDVHFTNIKVLAAVNLFIQMKGANRKFENELDALKYLQELDYPNEVRV